jgi:hypothetical protein
MNKEDPGLCIFCDAKVVCQFPNSIPRSVCSKCADQMEEEEAEDREEDGPHPDDE